MTDDELKAIEAEALGDCSNCFALVAEVRRLRELVKAAEWFCGIGAYDSEHGCPWCESDGFYEHSKLGKGRHEATCPAFTEGGDVR